jgi:hypothetical protein
VTKPAIGGCVIAPWEVCYPYTPFLSLHPLQATSGKAAKASGQPYYAFYYVIFSFPIPRSVIMIPQPGVSSLSPSSTPNDLSLRGGLSYVHTCDAGEASLARIRFAIRTALCSPLLRFFASRGYGDDASRLEMPSSKHCRPSCLFILPALSTCYRQQKTNHYSNMPVLSIPVAEGQRINTSGALQLRTRGRDYSREVRKQAWKG